MLPLFQFGQIDDAFIAVAKPPRSQRRDIQKQLAALLPQGFREQGHGSAEQPRGLFSGVGEPQRVGHRRQCQIDPAHFPIHLVGSQGCQRQALCQKGLSFLLRQKTFSRFIGGEAAVCRAQYQQMMGALLAQIGQRAHIDLIQTGRNGANLILGQNGFVQLGEIVGGSHRLAEDEPCLFQGLAQNLIELGKLLPQLTAVGVGLFLQAMTKVQFF